MASIVSKRKLVVLGIPYDVETAGLRDYMEKFGRTEDAIVMKDRTTGRSRGFGYVTFSSEEDAEKVANMTHTMGERQLDVKIATPKEAMKPGIPPTTRIFVAKIPTSVTEDQLRTYFAKFGNVRDAYMPRGAPGSTNHRGIAFVTFESSEIVDAVVEQSHEIDGNPIAVDKANPKQDEGNSRGGGFGPDRSGGYRGSYRSEGRGGSDYGGGGVRGGSYGGGGGGAYLSPYDSLSAMGGLITGGMGAFGQSGAGSIYGARDGAFGVAGFGASLGTGPGSMGKPVHPTKVFIGKIPQEANADVLRDYFSRFGPLEDVYVPKDPSKSGHRGFAFITFREEEVAAFVAKRPHEICGRQVVADRATLPGESGKSSGGASLTQHLPSLPPLSSDASALRPAAGSGGPAAVGGVGGVGGAGAFYAAQQLFPTLSDYQQQVYQAAGGYVDYAAAGNVDSRSAPRSEGRYRPY